MLIFSLIILAGISFPWQAFCFVIFVINLDQNENSPIIY